MEVTSTFGDILKGSKPVLVDFFAEWCGPCKMMVPILKELKESVGEKAIILKIDIDKNPALARRFQVQGVPTLIVFQHGLVKWRQSGVVPTKQLRQVVEGLLL
ncbi:MAG: hypothetical protein RL634_1990 [Bacteroidota bacterium]|jgi:thioredoxin 1|nr:thioredoxin [Chitinophagia bacterium]